MDFSIVAQPQIIHPAYNPVVFGAYSVDYTLPGFRYVFSFYKSGETTFFQRLKAAPNPSNGYGIVDVSKALQTFLSYDFLPENTGGELAPNSVFRYDVQLGYEFIKSWSFTDFEAGSGIYVDVTQLNGTGAPVYSTGDFVNIMSEYINGTYRILEIGADYITIDLSWSIVSGYPSTSGITYAHNGELVSDYEATSIYNLNTFNAAYSFVDWKSFDDSTIPMQGPTTIFLTDAPRTNFTIKPWQELFWNVYDNGWNTEYMVIAENSNGEIYKLPFSGAPDGNDFIQLNVGPNAGWETFTEYPYSASTLPMVKDNTEWYKIKVTDGHCLNECDEVSITINFISPFPSQTYIAYRTAQIYNGKSVYEFFIGSIRYAIYYTGTLWQIKQDGVIYTFADLQNDCECTTVDWTISGYTGTSNLYVLNPNFPVGHIQYGFDVSTPTYIKSFKVTWATSVWQVTNYNTGAIVALGSPATTCPADSSFEPYGTSPFSLIRMYGCEKDCPSSEYQFNWHVNSTNYPLVTGVNTNIQNCYGEQQITEEFTINIDHTCQDNQTQILFLDRKGSWSSFAFPLKVQERMDNEKLGYRTNIGFVQDEAWTYNLYDSEAKTYHSNVKKQYNLTTHWLNKEMDTYFEELISSPVTYIKLKDNDEWLSCNILTKSLEPITRRLIQRTITIELNSQDNINI